MPLDVKMFKKQNLIHYGRWVNQKPTQSEQPHVHCNYGVISNLEILNLLLCISSASLASHCHHCVLSNNLPVFLELLFPHILAGCLQKVLHLLFSIWVLLSQFLLTVDSLSFLYPFSPAQSCLCTSPICFLPICQFFTNLGLVPFSEAPHVTSPLHLQETFLPNLMGFTNERWKNPK